MEGCYIWHTTRPVLGPLLFAIFIKDLPDCLDSDVYLFADDTKIYKIIKGDNYREALLQDLKKMTEWNDKWLLKFHQQKCKSMTIAKTNNETEYNYNLEGKI